MEAGGTATQAGIYYQNTVAALYLGRMLDLKARHPRDRVLNIRLEAPEEVDDIVCRMGDGSRRFIQAKLAISLGTNAWTSLWRSFSRQLLSPDIADDDRLVLVTGEASALATSLRECCTRTTSAVDDNEYLGRLSNEQKRVVESIRDVFRSDGHDLAFVRRVFSRTDIEVIPSSTIERDEAPRWMPDASVPAGRLLIILRDIAGGGSRFRASFESATLRDTLKSEHDIDVTEPGGWGAAHYRAIIAGRAVIEIPGTSVAKQINDSFPWPKAIRYDRTRQADFDDETPRYAYGVRSDEVDLSLFPSPGLDRLVVIAGPGFGKSVLTAALAARLAAQGRLPVIISIPELANLDVSVGDYLKDCINTVHEVTIDWMRAAEAGLLILLFDGLDEVASDQRTVILERIKTFALRHPTTPWLLTVRDAAALAAPTDALLVELEPLDDADIVRHIEFYRPDDSGLPEQLRQQFYARPDVLRLARIPLFLAILLATLKNSDEVPSSRTELLETYLELLFRPEQFKSGRTDTVDPALLRPIAEATAFYALERDEIGVTTRILEMNIRSCASSVPIQPIIERLGKCGVLKRTSPVRYVFPFPIVQEYLAACHISATRLAEIAERLSSTAKRPWAQALQFVLEQHPTPNDLVRGMLDREDDAFNTNLRLIARCVANGMRINEATRQEIGRRLAIIWPRASWRQRDRIGELIAEAFSDPLLPEIRLQLSKRWLLHSGTGSIVARVNDTALTKSILNDLLSGDIEHLFNLGNFQASVDALGDDALFMYAGRIDVENPVPADVDTISCLIEHLDGRRITEAARLSVAHNTKMPLAIRLSSFALGSVPIDDQVLPLIGSAITTDGFQPRSSAMKALAKTADPLSALRTVFSRKDISLEQMKDISSYLAGDVLRLLGASTILDLAHDPSIGEYLRHRFLVYSARLGNDSAMNELVCHFADMPIEIVCAATSLFGYHQSRPLVVKAVSILRQRLLGPRDRVALASGAVTGMTTIFEMDYFMCGVTKPAPPHLGIDIFRELLEQWGAEIDYAPLDTLRIDEYLVRIGSGMGLARLPGHIEHVLSLKEIDLGDTNNAGDLGRAIHTLQEHRRFLPLSLLELIISRCSYNGVSNATQMMAAIGSRDAFDCLLQTHAAIQDRQIREVVLDAIEVLAGRLGLRVREVNNSLEASAC
jgi:hypothetical protein